MSKISQFENVKIIIDGSLKHHFVDEMTTVPVPGQEPRHPMGFDGLYPIEQDLKELAEVERDGTIGDEGYVVISRISFAINNLRRSLDDWERLK